MPSIFQPQTMPVHPWCYYRAFKITAQGNDTMAGKQQWYFWLVCSSSPPPPPPPHPTPTPPHGCCPSLLTFPECLPASETPSNTQWHLERRKWNAHLIWPHHLEAADAAEAKGEGRQTLDSSTKKKKTTIGGGSWLCRCAAVLLKSVRGRFARLPYPKPPSCKECSFLSLSEERVKPS